MNSINELIKKAHSQARLMGWWDEERNTGELLMLIVSECGEALEAHRNGKRANLAVFDLEIRPTMAFAGPNGEVDHRMYVSESPAFRDLFRTHIKDTFEDELADIVIRIADWMGHNQWAIGMPYVPSAPENVGQALYGVVESIVGYEHGAGESPTNCDTAIHKVFAISKAHDIDLWRHIGLKLEYNLTRGNKHGKSY